MNDGAGPGGWCSSSAGAEVQHHPAEATGAAAVPPTGSSAKVSPSAAHPHLQTQILHTSMSQ